MKLSLSRKLAYLSLIITMISVVAIAITSTFNTYYGQSTPLVTSSNAPLNSGVEVVRPTTAILSSGSATTERSMHNGTSTSLVTSKSTSKEAEATPSNNTALPSNYQQIRSENKTNSITPDTFTPVTTEKINNTNLNITLKPRNIKADNHTAGFPSQTKKANDSKSFVSGRYAAKDNRRPHHSSYSSSSTSLDSSIITSLIIGLIAVIIIIVFVFMLICVMQRWRTNMIHSASNSSVVYSLLRQNETDPEDQLGQILVNIGLASESDIRPSNVSSASSSPASSASPSPVPHTSPSEGEESVESKDDTQPIPLDDPPSYHPLIDAHLSGPLPHNPWSMAPYSPPPSFSYRHSSALEKRLDESDEELLQ